jgi:hypothetical protein
MLNTEDSMDTRSIIAGIDAQISELKQAKAILLGNDTLSGRIAGNGKASLKAGTKPAKKRKMSAEGKAKIAAAQKARWAKVRKAAKKATK